MILGIAIEILQMILLNAISCAKIGQRAFAEIKMTEVSVWQCAIKNCGNADPEVIEKSKKQLGQMEASLGNEKTIASLVDDILDHYENYRENLLTGKAMIVAYSRPIAMKIYERILQLRPSWTEKLLL